MFVGWYWLCDLDRGDDDFDARRTTYRIFSFMADVVVYIAKREVISGIFKNWSGAFLPFLIKDNKFSLL